MRPPPVLLLFVLILLAACAPGGTRSLPAAAPSGTPPAATAPEPTSVLAPLPTETPTFTPPPPPPTDTPTFTPLPTDTATTTPAAPLILRGKVLEHANCRYGPGAVFLYKYGLLPETNMEVIGRDEAANWLLVRAIGGDNPCWLRATLMDVRGDPLAVPQVDPDVILPWSPYYPSALTGVSASRSGSEVIVSWNPLVTKAGDEIKLEASQMLYVIEAWVCREGKITFTVVGSNTTFAKVPDEAGCAEPSHGRVYGAEKHGYTPWMEIPWPPLPKP